MADKNVVKLVCEDCGGTMNPLIGALFFVHKNM